MLTQTSATGAVTQDMQRDFNVQVENSNAKSATSLVTSQQYVTRKAKVNNHLTHPNQENQKLNNCGQGPYTPFLMKIALIVNQKTTSVTDENTQDPPNSSRSA